MLDDMGGQAQHTVQYLATLFTYFFGCFCFAVTELQYTRMSRIVQYLVPIIVFISFLPVLQMKF